MSYGKEKWFMLVAASLFLVGAVLLLVNTFAGEDWARWAGLGFACLATIVYLIVVLDKRRWAKKYTISENEIVAIAEQKAFSAREDAN